MGDVMTKKELAILLTEAESLSLRGWELLLDTETALRECNGIGARWMRFSRWFINFLFPLFRASAAIHDMRYFRGGDWRDRERADREFLSNCIATVNAKLRRWNPLRIVLRNAAKLFYYLLRLGGYPAWNTRKKEAA